MNQTEAPAEVAELKIPKPQSPVAPVGTLINASVATDALRSEGVLVVNWLQSINTIAPNAVRCESPELKKYVSELRIAHYEGDAMLPLQSALELLRYAGLTPIPATDGHGWELVRTTTQKEVSEFLSAPTNPDSLTWGVFKPWTRFSISGPGYTCRVENASDGVVLISRYENAVRDAETTILVLSKELDSTDPDVRLNAAWKLGDFAQASALEALFGCIEKSNESALTSTALAALCRSEKLGRGAKVEGAEMARRVAVFQKLQKWLEVALVKPAPELAPAISFASRTFAAPSERESLPNASSPLRFAAPNWRRFTMENEQALIMLRSNEPREVVAALWRWNRPGADRSAAPPIENSQTVLFEPISRVLETSSSAHVRRMALEALYRRGEKREGIEYLALMENPSLAQSVFLRDPDAGVQKSAAAILARTAGVVQMNVLRQSILPAKPPAGVDLILTGFVDRFWLRGQSDDETNAALDGFVENMLLLEDPLAADRAAWARMQHPALDTEAKLRAAFAFKRPSQRASALNALGRLKPAEWLAPKFISVFLHDNDAFVRATVFNARLLRWIQPGPEYAKLCERGLFDPALEVRLAALASKETSLAAVRSELLEQVTKLAENDDSAEIRSAAKVWLAAKDTKAQ